MYHKMKKESSHLRAAIYNSYKAKCAYCGRSIQERDMHIDHIIPSNAGKINDDNLSAYIFELNIDGFEVDSIENYQPSCPACNILKSNKVYSVSNLRFYHENARSHVEDILKRIEKLKNTQEVFFEPVNEEMWDCLDFSYQHDLSYAIMGYRLTQADVEACPRFEQVERIKKQLSIVDYVVIEGATGCGKSISLYQAAYDMNKEGWKVYSCKLVDSTVAPIIPQNTELSLYIIDDAQRFPEKMIEDIKRQARANAKILFGKTLSSEMNHDTILITNQDAVTLMYNDFLHKKKEVVAIVHQYDESIGVNYLDQPIEYRLNIAKKAQTPWQFAYILRGGWQTMKEQYKSLCMHNDSDLLVAAIAVFQIAKLDNSVDYAMLCSKLEHYDKSLSWNIDDLKYLVDKKIVCSEDDVRIVHMESAKVIISLFIKDGTEEKKSILYKIVEDSFIKKEISPLGIVWLNNGIRSYLNFYDVSKLFISEKMIDAELALLGETKTAEERLGITYFVEKIYDIGYPRNGKYYFEQNQDVFLNWIETAESKTAYAYYWLMNAMCNDNRRKYRKFVQRIEWTKLQDAFMKESCPDLYAWGKLFYKILCFYTKDKRKEFGKFLEDILCKVTEQANVSNIGDVSVFMSSVAYANPEFVHSCIEKLLPVYKKYFELDIYKGIDIFDFEFYYSICGFSLLGGHRATSLERQSAKSIVSLIPEVQFANMINSSQPRDWNNINHIIHLIFYYDSYKVKRIVTFIDLDRLSEQAQGSWEHSYEISVLMDTIYLGDPKKAKKFIEGNKERISTMYSSLAMYAPRCAIDLFRRGVTVDLLTEHWWDVSLYALKLLVKIDEKMAKEILLTNVPQLINRLNDITALNFNDNYCLKFLRLVKEIDLEMFDTIVEGLDKKAIMKNWT